MSRRLSLRLLIDDKAQKVLFAEVGKEVVDFLFSLLSMPLATIIKLLSKDRLIGCTVNLYESVERLDETYFKPKLDKDEVLLNPKILSPIPTHSPLLLPPPPPPVNKYYGCISSYNHNYITDYRTASCPSCKVAMTREVQYVPPPPPVSKEVDGDAAEGYVKGVVTYMVTDDLTVSPMSIISSITVLTKFRIKDVSVLREETVELAMEEALELIKAAFGSTTVLTDAFLKSKVIRI